MDLTQSYDAVIPNVIRRRYEIRETRNAAGILLATNRESFMEVLDVLGTFELEAVDITEEGGNKSTVARRLDTEFRERGWREGRHDLKIRSVLRIMPYKPAGEMEPRVFEGEVVLSGDYQVDNVKGRVALDVEWHAKDGNLDRDVGAYRALYDAGIIDGGIIITRSHGPIRALSVQLGRAKGFATTTTTTLEKLEPRLARGDGGGCPILAVAITDRCFSG